MWSAGTARSPVRGDVDLEVDMSPDTGPAYRQHTARVAGVVSPNPRVARGCGRLGRVLQRPPAGTIPDAPGSYQFRDRDGRVIYVGKAKSLRSRLSNYFQNPANLPPRTAQMVASGRERRVDPGPQRRRSGHARVQPHQAAQAPLQRPAAGRQELPVPGRDRERRVAPGHGQRGDQGQGQPLLRALRPRLRHPGDARLAAADLPDPHLQRQQVPHPRAAGPAVPAVPHREVLGPVRPAIDHDDYQTAGRRAGRLPRRRHPAGRQAAGGGDAAGGRRPRVRAGRPAARPADRGAQGHREAADGRPSGPRTSTASAWSRTSWRRPSRSSTCAGAGSSGARASSSTRSRT